MLIGAMSAQLTLHGVTSLKQKRSIVKSLIGRLKSRFNASVAEIDHLDSKQSAIIGIVVVSNESRFVDQQLDTIIGFMRQDGRFYLGRIDRETFSGPEN